MKTNSLLSLYSHCLFCSPTFSRFSLFSASTRLAKPLRRPPPPPRTAPRRSRCPTRTPRWSGRARALPRPPRRSANMPTRATSTPRPRPRRRGPSASSGGPSRARTPPCSWSPTSPLCAASASEREAVASSPLRASDVRDGLGCATSFHVQPVFLSVLMCLSVTE